MPGDATPLKEILQCIPYELQEYFGLPPAGFVPGFGEMYPFCEYYPPKSCNACRYARCLAALDVRIRCSGLRGTVSPARAGCEPRDSWHEAASDALTIR